jgi:hypothetical protein
MGLIVTKSMGNNTKKHGKIIFGAGLQHTELERGGH